MIKQIGRMLFEPNPEALLQDKTIIVGPIVKGLIADRKARKRINFYQVRITDDEFEETVATVAAVAMSGFFPAIIDCYTVKGLNVAENLAFKHCQLAFGKPNWSIDDQVKDCLANVPTYDQYYEQVKTYLERFTNLKGFW